MSTGARWILILWVSILAMACARTQPQRPVFHGQQTNTDTASLRLIAMHHTMAEQADLQLAKVASKEYVLMDEGYWVKGLKVKQGEPLLQEGEYVDVSMEFYTFKNQLLATHQSQVLLGQVDEIQAVVDVLSHMQHQMQVSLLVPWYLAFGSAGSREIPPYENLRIEISVQ